ncbi:FKBP-type peptidyl-prolyl cis-trans isomerase [Georgenia yuyongxinii]|uniref:Peptidyl-prolyl cis-trans isomerase n=1 Tax=Georgenia yuyongxinii TaxID=2589797 RepID=A0A5B8C2V5_9MICO|nr:FKBP-type peptidyl-prolyl cis-trans isomerase [Georgenia yuyongxinii]QDC24477.1 FKBP-type peptidyl-prolyl cis-trans isomerase [Georgenia yuyongxinii]
MLAAWFAAVLLVLLTACTSEEPPEEAPEVGVSGAFGSVPVVTFTPPLPLTESSVETIIEGDGRELAADEPVVLTLTAYDGDDGGLVENRGVGEVRTLTLTPEDVGADLYPVLVGAREGSRLLVRQPVEEAGTDRMLVLVIDVRYTTARGEPVKPAEGLPTVTVAEDGTPTITLPEGDPPDQLVVQPLLRGDGGQVRPGQDVTVQYAGVAWESGELYDSTWAAGKVPRTLVLGDTIPGLRDGLLDQTVGSQVLLVIPPAQARGTDTLVLVVDVLATSGGDTDSVVENPPGSAGKDTTPDPSESEPTPAPADTEATPLD